MREPHRIIVSPVITEKSTTAGEKHRKYSFHVEKGANKIEIRRAVEKLFKVNVTKVNVISMRGKLRRVRYQRGKTPDWKKAIVTVKEGQKIEFA